MEKLEILSIHNGAQEHNTVPVSEEVPLTIELAGKELATLLSSPADIENLVTGFLLHPASYRINRP